MRFEPLVGATDQRLDVGVRIVEYENGIDLIGPDDSAFSNFGKGIENSLHIFGMDVQSFGCDDQFLLAAAIIQPSLRIDLAEVAGVQPHLLVVTLSPRTRISPSGAI